MLIWILVWTVCLNCGLNFGWILVCTVGLNFMFELFVWIVCWIDVFNFGLKCWFELLIELCLKCLSGLSGWTVVLNVWFELLYIYANSVTNYCDQSWTFNFMSMFNVKEQDSMLFGDVEVCVLLELWRLLMSQKQYSMLFCLMLVKDWGGSWTRLVERAYPFWCAVQRVARMYALCQLNRQVLWSEMDIYNRHTLIWLAEGETRG